MDRLPELLTLPRPEKILDRHLQRLAVVYVRQSTVQQMIDHRESTNLQYGLVQLQERFWAISCSAGELAERSREVFRRCS